MMILVQKVNTFAITTNVMVATIDDTGIKLVPDEEYAQPLCLSLDYVFRLQKECNTLVSDVHSRLEDAVFHIDENGFWVTGKIKLDLTRVVRDGNYKWI